MCVSQRDGVEAERVADRRQTTGRRERDEPGKREGQLMDKIEKEQVKG